MTTDYSQASLEYRKKRNQVLLVLIGYFPLALLLFFAIPVSMFNLGFGFLNFCWLAVLAFVILRLRAWVAHDAAINSSRIRDDLVSASSRKIVGTANYENIPPDPRTSRLTETVQRSPLA